MPGKQYLNGRIIKEFAAFPIDWHSLQIQTMSAVYHSTPGKIVPLSLVEELRKTGKKCLYEPELFPAIRFLQFSPVCVNLFVHSGKVTLLGLKSELQGRMICKQLKAVLHEITLANQRRVAKKV